MRTGTFKLSNSCNWKNAGSITLQQAALAATARTDASVKALAAAAKVSIAIPDGTYAALFRFRSDGTEDVDSILQMYVERGIDHYHRIAQLTITQGAQIDSGSIYFNDTILPGSEDALFAGLEYDLTDMIAHYYVRTLGFDKFLFVCSDLDTTTVYVDVRWLCE